jgi:hypothetical protein
VDGRRSYLEIGLDIGFSRRATVDLGVVVNVGQLLALFMRVAQYRLHSRSQYMVIFYVIDGLYPGVGTGKTLSHIIAQFNEMLSWLDGLVSFQKMPYLRSRQVR